MQYANIYTNEIVDILPETMTIEEEVISNPTIEQLATIGWRTITEIESVDTNLYTINGYVIIDIEELTCKLAVEKSKIYNFEGFDSGLGYYNLNTTERVMNLPTVISNESGVTFNPTNTQLCDAGWRSIIEIEQPQEGYTVIKYTAVELNWTQCKLVIAESESIAEIEQARQDAKSPALKQLETAYCNFLETSWTMLLRSKGIIAPDYTITVENTDTITNTTYLLGFMQSDMSIYTPMSTVFLGFTTAIEGMGGTMADCRKHVI